MCIRKLTAAFILLIIMGCSQVDHKASSPHKIKNVILIIGDGMGPQQLELLQLYAKYAKNSIYKNESTSFEKMANKGEVGMVEVHPDKFLVTDSSCSATQYATGEYSLPETIGVNDQGQKVPTIIDLAQRLGKSTGLVTDTRITHATPASFVTHISSRGLENQIAEQLVNSNVDVLLGGGLRHFLPKSSHKNYKFEKDHPSYLSKKSKRKDDKDLIKMAGKKGYNVIFSKKDLELIHNKNKKLLGLFKSSGLPDGLEIKNKQYLETPSLKDMAKAAITKLSQNKKGFFLMIEAGQIDWAGHQNDTGLMLAEMIKMDQMLGSVLEWAKDRDDTIVVLTADHETGSFGFSYNALVEDKSYDVDKSMFKNGQYKPHFNYVSHNVLDGIYNQKISFSNIYNQFLSLDENQQNAQSIMKIVNANSDFKIDLEAAKRIVKTKKNPYYDKTNPRFKNEHLPAIVDFAPFYPVSRNAFAALIGREVSGAQSTVWGSGSHTSTGIVLVAYGPEKVINKFDGVNHSTTIGKILQSILLNGE